MGFSDWMGTENKTTIDTPKIDPNAYETGGHVGGAQQQIAGYENQGNQQRAVQGAQVNNTQYNQDRGLEMGGRDQQQGALDLAQSAAQGNQPSAAQYMLNAGYGRAMQGAASTAASARGGGSLLAAAQQGAQQQGAQITGDAANQAGMLRANEMATARGQYLQGTDQMRGQDLQRGQQSAQNAQYQAGLQQQQQGVNATTALGYSQLGERTQEAQLQAQQAQQAQKSQNQLQQQQQASQQQAGNVETNKGWVKSAAGAASDFFGSLSDENAKEGIIPAGVDTSDVGTGTKIAPGGGAFGLRGLDDVAAKQGGGEPAPTAAAYGGHRITGNSRLTDAAVDAQVSQDATLHGDQNAKISAAFKYGSGPGGAEYGKLAFGDGPINGNGGPGPKGYEWGGQVGAGEGGVNRPTAHQFFSDEKKKTGVQGGESMVSDALSKVKPYEYQYKDPANGEGRRVGVMAQDLEKSRAGAPIVENTPQGKVLDTNKAVSFNLAAAADLDKRLRAVEGKGKPTATDYGTMPASVRGAIDRERAQQDPAFAKQMADKAEGERIDAIVAQGMAAERARGEYAPKAREEAVMRLGNDGPSQAELDRMAMPLPENSRARREYTSRWVAPIMYDSMSKTADLRPGAVTPAQHFDRTVGKLPTGETGSWVADADPPRPAFMRARPSYRPTATDYGRARQR